MADIAVLFRSGPHALATKIRYALKFQDEVPSFKRFKLKKFAFEIPRTTWETG